MSGKYRKYMLKRITSNVCLFGRKTYKFYVGLLKSGRINRNVEGIFLPEPLYISVLTYLLLLYYDST